MTKAYFAALAAFPLILSACTDRSDDGDDGFEMTIGSDDEPDQIKIGGDDDSKFSIKTDGFSMDVDLPSISIDSDDFDLNNVALFPGTKVTGMNVQDIDGEGGKVILDFVAPTNADDLVSWFEEKMTDENFVIEKDGNTLSGKTDEGDPFSLSLTEKSENETDGQLEFRDKK